MKRLILPLFLCLAGVLIAEYMFGVDVLEMFEGFVRLMVNLLKGDNN